MHVEAILSGGTIRVGDKVLEELSPERA